MRLKRIGCILLVCLPACLLAQQYPFWTQYRSNLFMLNPAVAGTRQDIDARLSYRYQWVGFEGAPKTMGASFHAKLYKNKMGLGAFVFQDQIGPFKTLTSALAYAFKIKFDDVALSFGANGSYNMQQVNTSLMTFHNTQDQAILNMSTTKKDNAFNAAAGIMLYNDRFYIAASMNNLLGTSFIYDKSKATDKRGVIQTVPHYGISIGYNYSANSDYIWENSTLVVFVPGTPILFDYNLRLHIRQALLVGAGLRLGNAVVGQIGWTFENFAQVSYSYDLGINRLKTTNTGTHEVKIIYFHGKARLDHHKNAKEFQKQKFQYLI
jgi:type IX secretion system PorP/SprF family membrane protein